MKPLKSLLVLIGIIGLIPIFSYLMTYCDAFRFFVAFTFLIIFALLVIVVLWNSVHILIFGEHLDGKKASGEIKSDDIPFWGGD